MKIFASSLVLIVSVVFFGFSPPASVAAAYPEKPVTLIVPAGAGGSTDILARTMADAMKKQLPQPFVVLNRPGGGGGLGVVEVVKAKPDGYTLGVRVEFFARLPSRSGSCLQKLGRFPTHYWCA